MSWFCLSNESLTKRRIISAQCVHVYIIPLPYHSMAKVKRTITINHTLDEAISMLAAENSESYSGYVESRLLMNDNVKRTIQELEKLPKFPKINLDDIQGQKNPLSVQ